MAQTTKIADIHGNQCILNTGLPRVEYHRIFVPGEDWRTDPILAGAKNAEILYMFNWYSLTEEEKKECKSPLWEYDADNKQWHPQTKPYTGG